MAWKLLLFLLLPISLSLSKNTETPIAVLAEVVYVGMDCGSGGEIIVEINGDPDDFTYYWEHGPTSLTLKQLDPGIYTFHISNQFGCKEILEVEITELQTCNVGHQLFNIPGKCLVEVEILVTDDDGQPYDLSNFRIAWDDASGEGFERIIPQTDQDQTFTYQVESLDPNGLICCSKSGAFTIPSDKGCVEVVDDPDHPFCPKDVVINEYKSSTSGRGDFIELLVLGKCICGNNTDIKGFVLDDNNGTLIKGGNTVNRHNKSLIGINDGYLIFNQNPLWGNIPNGSILLIYRSANDLPLGYPALDPTDINQDGTYVFSANDRDYFGAKSGQWNANTKELDHDGSFVTPEWTTIAINGPVDGLQVRRKDGRLDHGISIGQSVLATNDPGIGLHLDDRNPSALNCSWTGTDLNDLGSYSCLESSLDRATPGEANSQVNEDFIDTYFEDCNPGLARAAPSASASIAELFDPPHEVEEIMTVFPNPFTNHFSLSFKAKVSGTSLLRIWQGDGRKLRESKINNIIGDNLHAVESSGLKNGVYILELSMPSGQVHYARIIKMD